MSALGPPPVACACGHRDYLQVREASYKRSFPMAYALYKCKQCGLVRTAPVPDPSIYEGLDIPAEGQAREREWLDHLDDDFRRVADGGLDGLPILDLGCNTGEMVATLAGAGYEAHGVDIDAAAVAHGRSKGLALSVSNIEQAPPEASYGAVFCTHTLEHTLAPAALIRNIAEAIPARGLLHIRVPNFGGVLPRLLQNDWGFLVPYQHVWQFTPKTLSDLVIREGLFTAERLSSRHHMEYRTTGLKGAAKGLLMWGARMANASDEIRGTYRRL